MKLTRIDILSLKWKIFVKTIKGSCFLDPFSRTVAPWLCKMLRVMKSKCCNYLILLVYSGWQPCIWCSPHGTLQWWIFGHILNPLCQLIKIYCILRKIEYLSLSSIKGSNTFLYSNNVFGGLLANFLSRENFSLRPYL